MRCFTQLFLLLVFFYQCIITRQAPGRCPIVRLQNGRAMKSRGRIAKFSCNDGFTLVGNKYSTCVRGQWDTPIPVCVNAECAAQPTPENALVATKYDGAILMYFCKPGYTLIGVSEIYCDGHQWNTTAPYCRGTNANAPTKCDFESTDLCWWEQDPHHDFDWQRHNFETPSSHIGTGPTHDHTLGVGNNGHYLYIEATGRIMNDTARIISPLYNSSLTESACFSFWYHMYGTTVGALRIYFKQENDTKPQLMFSKEGNQGNQWLHGIFPLPESETNFQIIVEGVRGATYVSDIAIDDVAILQGKECDANDVVTTSATENYNDQVELVSSLQTCRGRCNAFTTSHFFTINPDDTDTRVLSAEDCQCTVDCADYSICCPDYAEYCVLGFIDEATSQKIVETTVKYTTREFKMNATISLPKTTNMKNIQNLTTTTPIIPVNRNRIPINRKDDIDPNVTKLRGTITTLTSTTTSTTSIKSTKDKNLNRTTVVYPIKTPVTVTQNPQRISHTTSRKISYTITTPTKMTKAKSIPQYDQHESISIKDPQKFQSGAGKLSSAGIIGLIIGILTGTVVVTIIAFLVITKRRTYKRGKGSSALSEDSDVRFLTSDEILDFNLAKPSENDEL